MIKRRKMRLNGEWQLDGRNQVYELSRLGRFVTTDERLRYHKTFFCIQLETKKAKAIILRYGFAHPVNR